MRTTKSAPHSKSHFTKICITMEKKRQWPLIFHAKLNLFFLLLQVEVLQESFNTSCLEYPGLSNGDALEALQGCFDSSILSIFEDSPTGEVNKAFYRLSTEDLFLALLLIAFSVMFRLLNVTCFDFTH